MKLYTVKSGQAMTKKDWKDLVGNISFSQGAKARVCQSLGGKNSVVCVCGSVIDSKGCFREVSAPWCPFNLKLSGQKTKDRNSLQSSTCHDMVICLPFIILLAIHLSYGFNSNPSSLSVPEVPLQYTHRLPESLSYIKLLFLSLSLNVSCMLG